MDTPARPAAPGTFKADATLLALTAMWGVTFSVVKGALADADTFSFLALRFAVAGAVASALAGRRLWHGPSLRAGLLLGPFLFAGFALQTMGLRYTSASRSAFLTGLSVVLVPLVSGALYGLWPRLPSLLGVALSVAGTWWLSGGADAGQSPTLKGDVLTLGSAVAYAVHISVTSRLAARTRVTAMVAVQLWMTAVLALLWLPFIERRLVWTPGLVSGVFFMGVVASALGLNVQSWAQARTTAVRTALIFSTEPVFAAAYAALVTGERLGPREWTGGGLILLGILVAEVGAAVLDRLRGGGSAAGAA